MTTKPPPPRRLTRRQMEIALLFTDTDLSAEEVGERLGIAEATVLNHVSILYRALGVRSRPQLRDAMLAVELAPARGAR